MFIPDVFKPCAGVNGAAAAGEGESEIVPEGMPVEMSGSQQELPLDSLGCFF